MLRTGGEGMLYYVRGEGHREGEDNCRPAKKIHGFWDCQCRSHKATRKMRFPSMGIPAVSWRAIPAAGMQAQV